MVERFLSLDLHVDVQLQEWKYGDPRSPESLRNKEETSCSQGLDGWL